MSQGKVVLVRMTKEIEILELKSFKLDDIKELGEKGFPDVTDVRETGLTVISRPDYEKYPNNGFERGDGDATINITAIKLLSDINALGRFVVGFRGDIIIAGPFNDDNETISPIPEEWMNKIEASLK